MAKIVFLTHFLLKYVAKQDMVSRDGTLKRAIYSKIKKRGGFAPVTRLSGVCKISRKSSFVLFLIVLVVTYSLVFVYI